MKHNNKPNNAKKRNSIQNAGKISKIEIAKFVFEVIAVLTAIISIIQVQLTLKEMKLERDTAYRPNLCYESEKYIIQTRYDMSVPEICKDLPVFYEDILSGNDGSVHLLIRNIGVGATENLTISVSSESCIEAVDRFNSASKYCEMMYGDRDSDPHGSDWLNFASKETIQGIKAGEEAYEFQLIDSASLLYFDEEMEYLYVLPNAEQIVEYPLPTIYYCLINAMKIEFQNVEHDFYGTGSGSDIMIPDIDIIISYNDVQGVKYEIPAVIRTEADMLFRGGFSLKVSIIEV